VEGQLHSFLTSATDGRVGSTSRLGPLYSRGKTSGTHLKSLAPYGDSSTESPHYLVSILTELPRIEQLVINGWNLKEWE